MKLHLWDIETALQAEGFRVIAGVDEAGRGPLAGDVYAAAVILPFGTVIDGLDDSKKLSENTRERLFDEITELAAAYSVASATVAEIAELNILGATYLAMNRAIAGLKITPDISIIDGNRNEKIEHLSRTVIKGDSLSASIAAASVLAKVSRDRYMRALDAKYPGYGFARHKGYGTAEHYAAIKKLGATPLHRELFLRKMH
ncbi:MAG: ribonuclease HII [Oscillospiraceae bacterium]|jgi:ribonuclease HII|nr:ribonuclease HII [Oscillospiraceae bacterium]